VTTSGIVTIGHSTHDIKVFVSLLKRHQITAVADVRSAPVSRFSPQFNRDALQKSLREADIKYVFLGKELGARSQDPSCYVDGRVQYGRLAATRLFQSGIERLLSGAGREVVAVMCAEQDPLECHRTVLVARVLVDRGVSVSHIHSDGSIEAHVSAMDRLMARFGLQEDDLFRSREERLNEALETQERRIAYVKGDQEVAETLAG
jgi:uncharacterized protein (DUF488 family)